MWEWCDAVGCVLALIITVHMLVESVAPPVKILRSTVLELFRHVLVGRAQ